MKTSILFSVLLIVFSINTTNAQKVNGTNYLNRLPNDITLDKSIVRSYHMTTDYYDFNLKQDFIRKTRIKGILTYEGDSAQWRDVYVSGSKKLDAEFYVGSKLSFMQNFRYQPNENILSADFFKNNLPEADPSIMNLIWDALGFDALAYSCWDSLNLNEEFRAKSMNFEFKMADIGTFENKDIRITWLGITKINNKICAILKYAVMNNPLDIEYENMSMSGRSHYWGEIYVSLSDKQIEYANLTEDVLTDVKIKGQENNMLGYTIRYITLSKVNH